MSVDLSTRYLGLSLKNPLVVSACPLTSRLESLHLLEEAGAAAAVMPSLFEEQIEHDALAVQALYDQGAESFPEALSYLPELDDFDTGPSAYLRHIEDARRAVSIPLIGSLNGISRGGWIEHARRIEEAGAHALELNIYYIPTDPDTTAEQIEGRYIELVAAVRDVISIPLAVKIGPYFSSLAHTARKLVAAGADGLVLFNRFLQPDIDLETLRVTPRLVLSTHDELRLPLRWVAILRPQLAQTSLAATTGVHQADDALKLLLAGADAVMLASALYRHGPGHLRTILEGVRHWLDEKGYTSVEQMKGSLSQVNAPDPAAFERANYVQTLVGFSGTDTRTRYGLPRSEVPGPDGLFPG